MKTITIIIVLVLAVTQGTTSPPSTRGLTDNSLLYNLLQVAGFSDSCVSSALDYCSSAQEQVQLPSIIQEVQDVKEMVQQLMQVVFKNESRPRHCMDLLDSGDRGRGLRKVYPYSERPHHPVTVYCDQIIDGGGWTVFQRRVNNNVRLNFYRNWTEYEAGFGNVNGEFWLGLDVLHQLATTDQELRIDLYDYEGEHRWAKYGIFRVDSAETNYRITVERYEGDAGDSMAFHNNQEFSTYDADHDKVASRTCAEQYRGGWWYNECHKSNLNGYQYVGANSPYSKGITWYHWQGHSYSLRRTTMMVRPAP